MENKLPHTKPVKKALFLIIERNLLKFLFVIHIFFGGEDLTRFSMMDRRSLFTIICISMADLSSHLLCVKFVEIFHFSSLSSSVDTVTLNKITGEKLCKFVFKSK